MDEFIKVLEKIGLREKEAKVYLAAIELGESSVNDIAKKSGLPRTHVYDLLNGLQEFGIVSYVIKDNKKYFLAASPETLLKVVNERTLSLQKIIPKLSEISKSKGEIKPRIEFYSGFSGVRTAMSKSLTSKSKEIMGMGGSVSSYKAAPSFIDYWHKERAKAGIFLRIIYNDSPDVISKVKELTKSVRLAEYRLTHLENEPSTMMFMYSNKVIFNSWIPEMFSIIIEDKEIAGLCKLYFDVVWKNSRQIKLD